MSHSTPNQSLPVCIVSGGSSGIGLATSCRFAAEGYQLAICGRDEKKLAAAGKQIDQAAKDAGFSVQAFAQTADLTDVEQTKSFATATLDRFGAVDVLVNNAALAPLAEFENVSPESFEATTNVNVRSVFYLTQAIWKSMKQRPNRDAAATIVNVSSLSAIDPFPGFSLYGASKAWVDLLTEALATEGQESGIRVCSVRPGAVETPLLRGLFPDFPSDQCVSPDAVAEIILGCVTSPEKFPSGGHFEVTTQPETR